MPKSTITEICQYLHYNIDAIDTLPLSIATLCGSVNSPTLLYNSSNNNSRKETGNT
jgi:hypothetical protein